MKGPHSMVALVMAIGVAGSLLALAVAAGITEASEHLTLTPEASTLLSTSLGAAIGAVATYLGVRGGGSAPPEEQAPEHDRQTDDDQP